MWPVYVGLSGLAGGVARGRQQAMPPRFAHRKDMMMNVT
jgi:hypothetical protein